MDWTFDIFFSDVEAYKNGTEFADNYTDVEYRKEFIEYLADFINRRVDEWKSENDDRLYVNGKGYVGDYVIRKLNNSIFSDYYKEAYNQRPHLRTWYYVHVFGIPCGEDTARTFCASPIEDAVEYAENARTRMNEEWERRYA